MPYFDIAAGFQINWSAIYRRWRLRASDEGMGMKGIGVRHAAGEN